MPVGGVVATDWGQFSPRSIMLPQRPHKTREVNARIGWACLKGARGTEWAQRAAVEQCLTQETGLSCGEGLIWGGQAKVGTCFGGQCQ